MDDTTENAVQRARNLVNGSDPATIRQTWQDLRRSHHVARTNGQELPPFPYWALERVPNEIIPLMLEAEYDVGARRLTIQGPVVYQRFEVPEWHFALFFGRISHHMTKELVAIARAKPESVSFDSLYRRVKRIRDERLGGHTPPSSDHDRRPSANTLGFMPRDFRTYLAQNIIQGADPDYEQESNPEVDFESDNETNYEGSIYVGGSENSWDITSVRSRESTNEYEDDLGHSIGSNNEESSEGSYLGNDAVDYPDDHAIILGGSCDDNVSQEVLDRRDLTPESSNPVEEDPVNNMPSLIRATLPPSVRTLPANTPGGSTRISDASSSITKQAIEDQNRPQAEQDSTQTEAVFPKKNTSGTGCNRKDDDLIGFREKVKSLQSLNDERVLLREQRHTRLYRLEDFRERSINAWQRISEELSPNVDGPIYNAAERSDLYSDLCNTGKKHSRQLEKLEAIKAKRTKLDMEVTKVLTTLARGTTAMSPFTQPDVACRTPPNEEAL